MGDWFTTDKIDDDTYIMRNAFRKLNEKGLLHHGSGTFDYGDWAVWL